MKKVFIIHGYNSSPNGSWLPWLMAELKTKGVYACALAMPAPANPIREGWVTEIGRHVDSCSPEDEICLVGHSLGAAAVLNYAQSRFAKPILGAVLVSGRLEKSDNTKTVDFYESFDIKRIKENIKQMVVIHGDNDTLVLFTKAERLSQELGAPLISVKNGGHLSGRDGFRTLPEVLSSLEEMFGV